ncbi:TonB-dependent receptor [Asticcacaulis solisilvae]|uniref:TonB-dependent receptor n=1 Tax=Asticcacaulis solisilvae TaxID=1217274 RepID=UPI003FD89413
MTHRKHLILGTASAAAILLTALPAFAQDAKPAAQPEASQDTNTVVVVGQRRSLQRAAEIKRKSDNVVDSIVSDDIGKFPDNTVAAAMQRIPGVQTANQYNNEITGVIIRGLGDIETTLDGREIFTGVGRGYAFQDLPAESVAGVDVFKSNSADLVEGGVAGVVNIKRQKPFNFKKGLTIAGNLRANEGAYTKKGDYVASILLSDRFDTSAGQMGVLFDASYSDQHFSRPISFNCDPRSGSNGPPGGTGAVLPTCVGGLTDTGDYNRPQLNGVFQWKPNDNLEVYADAEYAGWKSTFATFFIFSDIFAAQSISNVQNTSTCFDTAHVNGAGFPSSDPNDPAEHLCIGDKATFNNVPGLTSTQAKTGKTDQYIYGGGLKWHQDRLAVNWDLSYIRSYNENRNTIVDIGKQISAVNITVDDGGHATTVMPGDPLSSPSDFRLANGLFQDYNTSKSTMFQTRVDGTYDFEGFIKQLQFGVRYADRDAAFRAVTANPGAPGGNRVTLVSSVLPAGFLIQAPTGIPVINNGAKWYTPDPDYLRDNTDALRALYGQGPGDPAWDPTRDYDASEKTTALYLQAKYGFGFSNGWSLDGLVGARATSTERDLSGTGVVNGVQTPQTRHTKDNDLLPNASARLRLTDHLQLRATYAKVITRPFFGDLNPGITYDVPLNANIRPSASGGNPDLRPEKSDNTDLTAEYYWGKSNYLEVAAYDRKIVDRTAVGTSVQTIGGIEYIVTQPLNLGTSKLSGYEVAGQFFFDTLPEGWNGLGLMANYTYAPSKVTDPTSPLFGSQIQGVSKTAYNVGLLYEKYGITGRIVYNWRDTYTDGFFGAGELTPGSGAKFNYVKPNGRLDFSVSYDINSHLTVSVDGVNINGGKYHSYFDTPLFPHDIRYDDKFIGFSLRAKY